MKRMTCVLLGAVFVLAGAPAGNAKPLQRRPFTVIAVVDSGIDPYHEEFRRPELQAHPSTYIEGFPRDVPAVELSFDERTYEDALAADARDWKRLKPNTLYWIPGTNIIGAIGPFDVNDITGADVEDEVFGEDRLNFFDHFGHGTGVASLAAGATLGPDAPDTLIVAVRGFERGLEWAAQQPWIDVITNSWSNPPDAENYRYGADASRLAVEKGKLVCFCTMNFAHPQIYMPSQGPSWNLSVGAASATTRGEHYYTAYPNDVLGLSGVPAAQYGTYDEHRHFAGTSAATPNVCGLIAETISHVRSLAGDDRVGVKDGALVKGAKIGGYLDDGKLTRLEIEDAFQSTAVPASSEPDTDDGSVPALPVAPFIRGGYGIVDEDSQKDALAVILGKKKRPERPLEDAWIAATDAVRDAIWGEGP